MPGARSDKVVLGFPLEAARSPLLHAPDIPKIDRLYREYWSDLCRRLRRVFGDGPPEPEDLAQSAFLKLAEMQNLDAIEKPHAYLFRAGVNIGLNSVIKIRRSRKFVEDALAEAGKPLEEISPSRVLEGKDTWRLVEEAFDRLSDKQREVVMRCRIRGETYAEISTATGWSQADISRQLNMALAHLQSALPEPQDR